MKHRYKTKGTCSSYIELELEDNCIKEVVFTGGCHGNLQGLSSLLKGMPAEEVCKRLEGIKCGRRATSCPDQLCQAIHELGF